MISNINSIYQMTRNKMYSFRPKIQIEKKIGHYVFKTVDSLNELKSALELRYQVFHRELIGKKQVKGLDIDQFDSICDHLIIIDTKTNKVVGTYRLNSSLFNQSFYSEQEFHIEKIKKSRGVKLELGRACVHHDYRKSIVISILWRGIAEYMLASNSDILFGCATVKTNNPREAALMYKYFQTKGHVVSQYFCPPTLKYTMSDLNLWIQTKETDVNESNEKEIYEKIPSLLKSYLKMGAFIGGEPAFDAEFSCIDFLTILEKRNLSLNVTQRFQLQSY